MAAALKLVPVPVSGTLLPSNETADQVGDDEDTVLYTGCVGDRNPDLVRNRDFLQETDSDQGYI